MASSYYKRASIHLMYTYVTHVEGIIERTWPPYPAVNDIFTPKPLTCENGSDFGEAHICSS